jgi:hypothetical protein
MDPTNENIFSEENFEHNHRVATALAGSDMVPQRYRGNVGNVMIAMEMAKKFKVSTVMAMQHVQVFEDGNLGLSSPFIIAMINGCGRFEMLRFTETGEGDDLKCIAWTRYQGSTEIIEGPAVSIKMAKEEGWYSADGSKWPTMPSLMLRYRSAAFFSRLHCPDVTLGMQSREEVLDTHAARRSKAASTDSTITVDDLRKLLQEKQHLFMAEELTHVHRIIDRGETTSFKKVQALLNSK